MANRQGANQLISQYWDQHQHLTLQREHDDDKTYTAYSYRLDELEASFHARLAPWREERGHLDAALSEAKKTLEKTKEEISHIEQSLALVSKCEEDLELNCRAEQECVVNEYERFSSTTIAKRQNVDLHASFALITELVRKHGPRIPRPILTPRIETISRRGCGRMPSFQATTPRVRGYLS